MHIHGMSSLLLSISFEFRFVTFIRRITLLTLEILYNTSCYELQRIMLFEDYDKIAGGCALRM